MPFPRTILFCLLSSTQLSVAVAHEPLLSPASLTADDHSTSEPGQVLEAFHAALAAGHLDDAANLLADDALIFEGGGAERSKAEYVSHHLPADAAFAKDVTRSIVRQSEGRSDNLAWIASESRTVGTYKGKPIDVRSTETAVLKQIGGDWRLIHLHWSSSR